MEDVSSRSSSMSESEEEQIECFNAIERLFFSKWKESRYIRQNEKIVHLVLEEPVSGIQIGSFSPETMFYRAFFDFDRLVLVLQTLDEKEYQFLLPIQVGPLSQISQTDELKYAVPLTLFDMMESDEEDEDEEEDDNSDSSMSKE